MFYLFWTVGDTLKGLLLSLLTNYRLIFLWKAQMAVIIAHLPPPSFQYGKSVLKSKKTYSFSLNHWNFTQRILKQWHMICYETAFWIENCRQIQNDGHDRPKRCNKTNEKMIFFKCCVWMHVYSTQGFWPLKGIV